MLVKKTIELDNNLLKIISEIAKNNSITEDKLINNALETLFTDTELSDECKEFYKELDDIDKEMKAGNCFKGDVNALAKEIGL